MSSRKATRWRCYDCGTFVGCTYMVRNKVWQQAVPEYAELRQQLGTLELCFGCLARRLGRELVPADFNLDLPINAGIRLGLKMAGKA